MPQKIEFRIENRILRALPADELRRLVPALQEVELPLRKVLSKPDAMVEHVHFVQRGMISLVRPLDDGALVEVGIIGREGASGISAALSARPDSVEAMVQLPGSALRLPVRAFRAAMNSGPAFSSLVMRYAHALMIQVSQTAACNGRHTLQERLARWLLMARDRFGGDTVPLAHEFLSMMLGSRRAGITVALGVFREAGIIANGRGKVVIRDLKLLEQSACECYSVVNQQSELLLSASI